MGFAVILAGLSVAVFSAQTAVGTISAAAGVVAETASYLFFRQNEGFQKQMSSSLSKLVSAQYLMTSIALARNMSADQKDGEISKINAHLRELMDTLHGARAVDASSPRAA